METEPVVVHLAGGRVGFTFRVHPGVKLRGSVRGSLLGISQVGQGEEPGKWNQWLSVWLLRAHIQGSVWRHGFAFRVYPGVEFTGSVRGFTARSKAEGGSREVEAGVVCLMGGRKMFAFRVQSGVN